MRHFYHLLTLLAVLLPIAAKADKTVNLVTNDPAASCVIVTAEYSSTRHDWNAEGTMSLTVADNRGINIQTNSGYTVSSISVDGNQVASNVSSIYYIAPTALTDGCTVDVQAISRQKTTVTIAGDPSQILVSYNYQNYESSAWVDGRLTLEITDSYSSVKVSARAGFGLRSVMWNGNNELNPGDRTFAIYPGVLKPGDNLFEVSSYSLQAERTSHFTVQVNGNPSAVNVRLAGDDGSISGAALNSPIAFSPVFDLPVRIESAVYGRELYQVRVGDKVITPSNGVYTLSEVADNEVVTVDVDYPDIDIPVRFTFTNPDTDGAVSNVTDSKYNLIPRTTWCASDFTVKMGESLRVALDTENFTLSATLNGEAVEGSYITFTAIDPEGYDIVVDATPKEPYQVTFYYEGLPAHFSVVCVNNTEKSFEMTGRDETVVNVPRNLNRLRVVPEEGWIVTYVYVDGVEASEEFTVTGNATVDVYVEEYRRDNTAVIYMQPDAEWVYGVLTLNSGGGVHEQFINLQPGYNVVKYNEADLPFIFDVRANGSYTCYFNGVPTNVVASVTGFADLSVFKFYTSTPAFMTVDLAIASDCDATVSSDIVTDITSRESVSVAEGTQLTITPAPTGDLTVKFNGAPLVAGADGTYTLTVTENGRLEVENGPLTGVALTAGDRNLEVYTLQGIRLGIFDSISELRSLPKGIYIVSGRKLELR